MREKVGSSYAYDAAAFVPSAVIGSGSASVSNWLRSNVDGI